MVFDASCKTNKNISLNEIQLVGEKLQRDLHEITMRFRRFPIAISADIQKMYRQVKIIPKQWNLQRIFWRKSPKEPIREYSITRVIYGMASAPHCSVRAMVEGANFFRSQYPGAVHAIENDFYVDDGLFGAIELAKEIQFVLEQSGFPLRKWKSNSKKLLKELRGVNDTSLNLSDDEQTSVLGLKWIISPDEFTYDVNDNEMNAKLTKRIVLSKIPKLYDPNGFVAPFITKAKIFMQILWKLKIDWDIDLPSDLAIEWKSIWNNIACIRKIRIPRYIGSYDERKMQIHGFSDASTKALGAVFYVRIVDSNDEIQIRLISSKSRIAPIKIVSIPRLELAAAELLSNLCVVVTKAMEWTSIPIFLWCDSTVENFCW